MEKQIQAMMKALDITEQEARELIEEDNKIDKMVSVKQINSDLSPEQQKTLKKYKNTSSHRVDAYGKKRTVERKPKEHKRYLIRILQELLQNDKECNNVNVTNIERQIDFKFQNIDMRIILSETRVKKT